MKIVTLIEDTKKHDHLINEFGLSLFIESNGTQMVLDTGSSGRFIQNSERLGIDLGRVELVFLSHAHMDHCGGLYDLLQFNRTATVYMHRKAVNEYYGNIGARLPVSINAIVHPFVKRSKLLSRYIGMDRERLRPYQERVRFIDSTEEVNPNIVLIANIDKKYPSPEGNKFFLTRKNNALQLDVFDHELALAVDENDGVVVFTGCGHSGILNILDAVKAQFNDRPIKAVVGGFHLKRQPGKDNLAGTREDVEWLAQEMCKRKIEKIFTGHCTGEKAYRILKERLKDRLEPLYTGCSIEL